MNKNLIILFFVLAGRLVSAQIHSPDQFLGYKLGSRFTPHHKVVSYFEYISRASSDMVKFEQYGETNEGKPLILTYISSPGNITRLESIRLNNLRLAGLALDKVGASIDAPAIVWLSYNVHGNEASSTEAAMLTIYELVNPGNARTKNWLKNTVVIIDPCINPDGRDRYVNWFTSVVGRVPNPEPFSREHQEPWPGGRTNHYYFDLNRDWAWQTQLETQHRILKYNQWLPHIHVDFHEQSYNEPYYFAPAAEPFHEVITRWQREFQTTIGRNNAKYFDEFGWLYFTKERFDLFYPSYGDTYPTYKGAIGMTYEQGGSSRAGSAVRNADGDTLTLWDRLNHHYTTGIATIETTSFHATKVVQEFKKYYDNARSVPSGEFKSYIIKADEGDKIERLKKLLDRNNIDWSYVNPSQFAGFNYFTNKNENFKSSAGDITININQPNSNLIKVLFERSSKLTDSVTYDITAWSVPYVYGLVTYGLNSYTQGVITSGNTPKVTSSSAHVDRRPPTVDSSRAITYAYAVKWNGLHSVKFLADLLKKGIRVRYAETPFYVKGKTFDKGTLLVTRSGNASNNIKLQEIIQEASKNAKIDFTPIESGFVDKGFDIGSGKVHIINAPRVALLAGDNISSLSMGEIWHFFDVEIEYPVNIILTKDLNRNVLQKIDVLIIPNGSYTFFSEKTTNEALKEWVNTGGKIIAIENALTEMVKADWGIKLKEKEDKKEEKKDNTKEDYSSLKRFENRERDVIPNNNPGSIFNVELDNSHPLAFGYPQFYYTLKQDDNIYEFFKEDDGWNVGIVKREAFVAGFTGSKIREKLKDGLLFGVRDMGEGSVIFLADNPLFRSFWENGKLLFANAVFLVGQ